MTPGDAVRAVSLLREAGVAVRSAAVVGRSADVLAVDASPHELARIRAETPRLRRLGFRYIAVELDGTSGGGGEAPAVPAHDEREAV